jgi:hypothetical protein
VRATMALAGRAARVTSASEGRVFAPRTFEARTGAGAGPVPRRTWAETEQTRTAASNAARTRPFGAADFVRSVMARPA